MAFPGGAYVTPQGHRSQQTPFHHGSNQLNPMVPGFHPTGTELQRYGPTAELTPPQSNMGSPVANELQRFVADTHFKHTNDILQVERMARQSQQDIQQTNEVVARDIQTLQGKLEQLQLQVAKQAEMQQFTVIRRSPTIIELDLAPPESMLQHFEPDVVTAVCVEQVKSLEDTVEKLRKYADQLSGERKVGEQKVLEAPTPEQMEKDLPVIVNGSSIETPTHMPPRRAQREQASRAFEIKVPTEAEAPPDAEGEPATNTEIPQHKPDIEHERERDTNGPAPPWPKPDPEPDTPEHSRPWVPLAVRNMKPLPSIDTSTNLETFTWEFLLSNFGGAQWSPGFYFISQDSILPSQAYWILDAETEPFLPSTPGQHGAKLTAFFNDTVAEKEGEAPDENNYIDTPVFIRPVGQEGYVYLGNYSQVRFSDKLDYERVMTTVPAHVREYWAEQLTASDRPAWVTRALMQHFWPRPTYDGPVPTDEAVATPATAESATTGCSGGVGMEKRVTRALAAYAEELRGWEKEAGMKVKLMTKEGVLEAFGRADAEMEPGLRLWWEYLECGGYDRGFYDMCVSLKGLGLAKAAEEEKKVKAKGAGGGGREGGALLVGRLGNGGQRAGAGTAAAAAAAVDGKFVSATNGIETVRPHTSSSSRAPQPAPATQSQTSTIRTPGTKSHMRGTKPWEKEKEELQSPPASAEQLQAAKAFAMKATKAGDRRSGGGGSGGGGGNRAPPPHMRR